MTSAIPVILMLRLWTPQAGDTHAASSKPELNSTDYGYVRALISQRQGPSPDGIFGQYLAALGGEEALKKVTSRRIMGTVEYVGVDQHGTAPVEIQWEAPDKFYAAIRAPFGAIEQVVNGNEGWGSHPQTGARKLGPIELLEARRQWSLYQPALLRDQYTTMRYEGRARVDDRECDVIVAESTQGKTERFYLDVDSRLPVRLDLWEEGPEAVRAGEFYLARYYLGDYRRIDGIAVPFSVRRVRPNSEVIYTFSEVVHNIPIDSKLFLPRRQEPWSPVKDSATLSRWTF